MEKRDLLIFGDSFGEPDLNYLRHSSPTLFEYVNSFWSYHDALNESNHFNNITNYAKGGSDLWSQYCKFKDVYNGEDILWFLTVPGRNTVRKLGMNCANLTSTQSGISKALSNNKGNDPRIIAQRSLVEYYKYIQHDSYDNFLHECIIKNIRNDTNATNLWLVPCFFNSYGGTLIERNKAVSSIYNYENKIMNFSPSDNTFESADLRLNHMTENNHKIFAKKLLAYIMDGKEMVFADVELYTPNENDKKKYIIPNVEAYEKLRKHSK